MGRFAAGILVVDDHPIVIAGIRMALEAAGDLEVIGSAGDGAEALAKSAELRPDILLLDLAMPGMNGIELIHALCRTVPETRIFVLTGLAEPRLLVHARTAGAAGIALKSEDAGVWIGLLRQLDRPGPHLSPAVRDLIASAPPAIQLSPREREVLIGIARGETSAQIAGRLGISMSTLDNHRTALMRKVGAHGIADLLRVALREGLLQSLGTS